MTPDLMIATGLIAFFLISFLFFACRIKRDDSPRGMQRRDKWGFYYTLVVIILFCILQRQSGRVSYPLMVCAAVFILSKAYSAFKLPSDRDLLQNHARDPGHCGRCNYDLTGNVSGICPECEWTIPLVPVQVEGLWAFWWSKWEIEYLDNWRRTLAMTSFFALVFFGLSIFIIMRNAGLMAILPAFMCLNMIINSIRVTRYGQRQRKIEKCD